MFETGRRSAISTSELGLYSDRGDRYNRNKYGPIVRKFVIGVMAVVAVVLAAIFIYDFASGASATSKVSQETKHIYILQNALKKPNVVSKRQFSSGTTYSPNIDLNKTNSYQIQDRSDNADLRDLTYIDNPGTEKPTADFRGETRAQSLANFKLRKRLLEDSDEKDEDESAEGKQLFSNHAIVYRVRQRYTYPNPGEEFSEEESRPAPFHFELKTPQPSSFNKRPKFPQLSQYRYPHSSRNIQDIIKYLTNDPDVTKRGIKFTGVYVNPKKYDLYPEIGEMMSNSDRNEYQSDGTQQDDEDDVDDDDEDRIEEIMSESSRFGMLGSTTDPFYRYKPKHPADVNLLAPSNVRFSPSGTHRYNPYYDPYFQRPTTNYFKPLPQVPIQEVSQYSDNSGAYSNTNNGKKRKPKPFSVMLDIYPITELNEQPNKKISRPRPVVNIDDHDPRRPTPYNRGQRYYPAPHVPPIPLVAVPASQPGLTEEEERQQMIFHLNLYPRKKNKLNRNDIIQRSESMRPEDHQKFMHSVMSPFDAITKQLTVHSAIEESKYEESDISDATNSPLTRNRLLSSEMPDEEIRQSEEINQTNTNVNDSSTSNPPQESTELHNPETENSYEPPKNPDNNDFDVKKDIDTPEGFQAFADSLLATD